MSQTPLPTKKYLRYHKTDTWKPRYVFYYSKVINQNAVAINSRTFCFAFSCITIKIKCNNSQLTCNCSKPSNRWIISFHLLWFVIRGVSWSFLLFSGNVLKRFHVSRFVMERFLSFSIHRNPHESSI